MKRSTMKKLSTIIALTLVAVILAACAPPAATPPGDTTPGGTATVPGGATVADVGNVFVFAGAANITQWDPLNENRTNTTMLNKLIYNTLVNPFGAADNITISPELAESWEVSADGMSWTFNLRQGVYFHNGEPFNSSSVVATLQRLLDNPTLTHAAFWPTLESVEAPEPYVAVINLTEPWAALLAQLVDTPMLPPVMLSEMGDEAFDFNDQTQPVGTGPWIAYRWLPGQDAEFLRNDNYWGWGDNKSTFERIIYRPVAEDTTRVSGLQAGDLTMIDTVPVEQAETLRGVDGITVEQFYSSAIVHLGFRTYEGDGFYRVFNDVNARKAVMHALDMHGIVNAIAGGGTPSDWPAPNTVLGYDATRAFEYEHNVELARELLGSTNYEGQEISFIVPTGVFARSGEIAQAIFAMLTEVGFNVNMEIMENAAFQQRRASADYDLYLQRYPFPVGEPDSVITMRWLHDVHMSGYVNPQLNSLIEESRRETNPAVREQILKDMFYVQWNTLAPHAALFQQLSTIAYLDGVSGLRIRPDNVIDYSRVTFTN